MRRLSVTTCPLEEGSQTVIVGYLVRSVYLKGSAIGGADMGEVSTTEVVVCMRCSLSASVSAMSKVVLCMSATRSFQRWSSSLEGLLSVRLVAI